MWYGPQNDGPEERIQLVLQFGGASGQGFLSYGQIAVVKQELSKSGSFEKGKYHRSDGSDPQDTYEAVCTRVHGWKEIVYLEGRYHEPILMDPDSFNWKPIRSQKGAQNASMKLLGVFSERETRAEMLKISGEGSVVIGGGDAIELAYVVKGSGYIGEEALSQESAVKLGPRTECTIKSSHKIELLHFTMPMLCDLSSTNGVSH